jgi:Helix-turn-helix domain
VKQNHSSSSAEIPPIFSAGVQSTIPPTPGIAAPRYAFTREEAAKALGISPATLDRLTKRGVLHPSRATRRPLYAVSEIERFLRETTAEVVL